ncbi:MAG: D-ribose pyranase [Verrucomicrobia bacterium]|nr:MAG: D-ribose pyranase [Verrucomicrobiota bacterium]
MQEIGIINRELARLLSEQGHGDMLMVVDAGFAIPKHADVVDISLTENCPMVIDTLQVLKKFFSVEKLIFADKTPEVSPSLYDNITALLGADIPVEIVTHPQIKELSSKVKAVIRTGDFTAYANVILVSGAGPRWYCEK